MEPDLKKAHAVADKVLKDNYVLSQPVNIREIAANYGFKVVELDYKNDEMTKDVAGVINPDRKRIYVEETDSEARKAFTIAHELGHWLLHQDIIKQDKYTVLYRRSMGDANRDPIEAEANYFAACLLVPEELFKKVRRGIDDPRELAIKFGVSEDMMGYRIKEVDHGTNE